MVAVCAWQQPLFHLERNWAEGMAMSVEDQFSWWPHGYVRRSGATKDGTFEAYVPGNPLFKLLDRHGVFVSPVRQAFIRRREVGSPPIRWCGISAPSWAVSPCRRR